ncbi:LysE family transporter [Urechidicola vernalis]|uniref:Lysine transporter LysE n=1 Tax=Urechidicola vernalis TaxID=3075600 RepID=A0ABU2Y375_9FLAO|nr:LysE family transporter [Urechidicola sp. P050]MDT0551695.1 hypothetical protein [Urechidicola sp. P050]
MEYITHVLLGIISIFIGLLPPGMLNMTAVQLTVDKGQKESQLFSMGAALVVFIQAGIALFFAKQLNRNPKLLENIEVAGIVVFFVLAVFFFIKTRSTFKFKVKKEKKNNYFFQGFLMSTMNMLAIPFFLAVGTYLSSNELLIMENTYELSFVFGAGVGAYLLFLTYIVFAKVIIQRANFIAKNINYILSLLFLFLGVLTWLK